jgi:hypothetical protein
MLTEISRHITGLRLEKPAEIRLIAEAELKGNLLETFSAVRNFTFGFQNKTRVQNARKRNIEFLVKNLIQPFRGNTESRSIELRMTLDPKMLFDQFEQKTHTLAVLVERKIALAMKSDDMQQKCFEAGKKYAKIIFTPTFKKHQIDKLLKRRHRIIGNPDGAVYKRIEQNGKLRLHDAAEKIDRKGYIAARRRLSRIGMHLPWSHKIHEAGLDRMRFEIDIMKTAG